MRPEVRKAVSCSAAERWRDAGRGRGGDPLPIMTFGPRRRPPWLLLLLVAAGAALLWWGR